MCRNILIATDCALVNAGFVLNYEPVSSYYSREDEEKEK